MRRAVLAALAACLLLGGCTAAIGGAGHVGLPAAVPAVPSVPNQPAPTVACPRVSDPQAGLSYRCVTAGIQQSSDLLWTLNLTKQVEPGWMLGEGSAAIAVDAAAPLEHVAQLVRDDMVGLGYWGPGPGVRTLSTSSATVAGVDAWVLASSFTINSAFRAREHLKARTERTWIVVLQVSKSEIALWYVTLPDDVKQLWPTVPALIKAIRLR